MRQIDQEIIEATDELKKDVALTTEIVTGNENTEVEVAPGTTVRSPKKMIEDCYRETQQAIEQQFGSLDKAVDDATSAANRADSASQSSSGSAGDSAASSAAAKNSADTATEQATAAAASASAARESEQAALQFSEQTSADASATADHEASAATWGERAEQQAKAAAQSSTTASSQATMAKAWAANPEDARVDGERYSSLHYASKSSEYADASSGNAELSRDQSMLAQQAMRNASNSEINANLSKIQAQQAATEAGQSKEASGVSEQKAADSAAAAKNSETAAVGAADSALDSKNSAAGSAGTATQQADRSESEADRSEKAAAGLATISNPNLLINGDFSVWQRGTNFTAHQYCADRWHTTSNVSKGQLAIGELSGLLDCAVVELNGDASLRQWIENGAVYAHQIITISAYFKSVSSSAVVKFNIFDSHSPNTTITDKKWTRVTYTVKIGFVSDLGHNHVFVDLEGTGTVYVTGFKAELGPVATPFIPDDPATNLAKCQRYYQLLTNYGLVKNEFSSWGGSYGRVYFPTPMRSAPTIQQFFVKNDHLWPDFSLIDIDTIGVSFIPSLTVAANTWAVVNLTVDSEL